MSGILDWMGDPANQGLLNLSSGLLQASGPSRMPVSTGQALGQGMQQGMQGMQQAQQIQMQQQALGLRQSQAQQQQAMEASRAAALARLAGDPRFAGMQDLLAVNPQAAIDRALPKDRQPVVVAPGAALVDPSNPNSPLFSNPAKPQAPSSLAQLLQERSALQPGDPRIADYDAAIKKATTSQPLVNVDNRQQGKFDEVLGREMGEQYAAILKADMSAPSTIGKYNRLGSLLGQVNTGKFKGATTDIKASAKALGIDLTALGVADDVAPAQAARALANQIALELRNPAGGAGMPGAMSEKDREFLVQSIPSLESDPGAITQMIEYRVKLAKREQEVAKRARAYKKKNGRFDEGFYDELAEWSEKNPMFPEAGKDAPVMPTLSPKAQKYLDAVERGQ